MLDTLGYNWDPLAVHYFAASATVLLAAAGVALYERFTQASLRFLVVGTVTAGWLATLGMAVLAGPGLELFWLRATWVIDPFTGPALFWMSQSLTRARRGSLQVAMWVIGAAFSVIGLQGPWLVQGLQSATRGLTLTGWGWLGALYFVFIATTVVLAVRLLAQSARRSSTAVVQVERRTVLAGIMIAGLTLADYWLSTATYRAGLLTPWSLSVAAVIGAWVAVRHRIFSVSRTFGTQEVLHAVPDVVLLLDEAGRIRGANRAASRTLAQREDQLVGELASEYLRTPAGRSWMPARGETLRDHELRLHAPDGPIAVSVAAEPLTDQGRVVGMVVVARDIRERLAAEQAREAAEIRYESIYWHNPGLTYEVDMEGRLVSLNDATAEILGRSADELVGRPIVELLDEESVAEVGPIFEASAQGETAEYELEIRSLDGEPVVVKGVSIPIMEAGEVVGVSGVAFDVTRERRAREELELQRRYFADLFENIPEAIVMVDEDDRVLRVNDEFTDLFGYTEPEVLGQSIEELIVPEELHEEGRELARTTAAGESIVTETVRRRKDGMEVDVSILARRLEVPGEPVQVYAIYRDISERKQAERALQEREEELRHAQKMEAVGTLAGGVAHDFNNLMTVITGHVRFALDDLSDPERIRADLEEIERAGNRAAELTQQLLAFSSRQVLRPSALAVNEVIGDTERMLSRIIGGHIQLRTRLCDKAPLVRADRGQLEQVLVNLAINARDAMPDGGELTVSAEAVTLDAADVRAWDMAPGPAVRITVADTGVGMEAETLDQVFDPFFTTKGRGKGTGLGLSTVFGIVKQSRGHVTVESTPGEGSRFHVYLPRHDAASAREAEEVGPAAGVPAVAGRSACTVLVVEDEAGVRRLAARVIERAGHAVITAENGREALRALEGDGAPDLVLTDMVMPEMDGRVLAEALRERWPTVPILFMSGYEDELAAAGADGREFLAKPFTPAELGRRVEELLAGDRESERGS